MADRLPIGLFAQLSLIRALESRARMAVTRGRFFGFHARHSSAHRMPVRGQLPNGPLDAG